MKIANVEFQNMIQLGHLHFLRNASPLYMVTIKGTLEWNPIGDFLALNALAVKERYTISCIADFTSELHRATIFSHIDLIKLYHQIQINPDDIPKTAICIPFKLFESSRMQF
ncbi:transposon Ty3-I Gag-Pol polyprotein [Nephila pilipes]|uniref:Transposon Ty3-I Gag-Pol polyprotein n=1 Tax=Nephila pilipes TaxID=299642 RepID=A0A8X6Q253_NEPPI|nr:transposon Ty3-I Gag-Pol polyprotein [Nephila pilipes]